MSWIGTSTGAKHAQNTLKERHQMADALRLTEEESIPGKGHQKRRFRYLIGHLLKNRRPTLTADR